MKTIDETLDYLYSFINYETNTNYRYNSTFYNVKRTIALLEKLGNPQRNLKIFHVAGTKGKGSVCMILAKLLKEEKFKVGLFLSPHIEKVNERISVNEQDISDEEFIGYMNLLKPIIDKFPINNKPTTFEILTALATIYFKDCNVDFAIYETGMGGRFDSTNFVNPLVSIITSISYDHMDKLGNTIEKIALEKAGIIKRNKPVVVGFQRYNIYNIFSKRAEELNSPYFELKELSSYRIKKTYQKGTIFNANIEDIKLKRLFTNLLGKHQIENILLVLLSLKVAGYFPEKKSIKKVLKRLSFKTRLEVLKIDKKIFILDSAHNEESAKCVVEALNSHFKYRNIISVIGIVKGKDVKGILNNISKISYKVIITEPITHKDLDTEHVYKTAKALKKDTFIIKNIYNAIDTASKLASKKDIILITGSFYTTSPARKYLIKKKAIK